MLRIGPHIDPPLAAVPAQLAALGRTVFQTTLRDPRRLNKDGVPDADDQAGFLAGSQGLWGMVHSSMLTSLGSPDPRVRNGSVGALVGDANLAAALGLAGVCFHVGYAKGHDTRDAALSEVARKLGEVVAKLKPGARVMLENGCEGSELGDTIAEVAHVANAVDAPAERLGFTLDTCHLHVAGFDMADPGAPEELANQIEAGGLTQRLVSLHLNDAIFPCGSRRDRHAAPGTGTIGDGLVRLLEHAMFASLPCILEIREGDVPSAMRFLEGT